VGVMVGGRATGKCVGVADSGGEAMEDMRCSRPLNI
jgi:hypothetical protein